VCAAFCRFYGGFGLLSANRQASERCAYEHSHGANADGSACLHAHARPFGNAFAFAGFHATHT
jgi:hypothetical protein